MSHLKAKVLMIKSLYSLHYITIDDAINQVIKLDQGPFLAKAVGKEDCFKSYHRNVEPVTRMYGYS